jgi:hypothetical protein
MKMIIRKSFGHLCLKVENLVKLIIHFVLRINQKNVFGFQQAMPGTSYNPRGLLNT